MKTWKLLGILSVLTTAVVVGCNNSSLGGGDVCADPNADPATCNANCTDPNGCGNQTAPEYVSISITPSPVMLKASGTPVSQALAVTGTRADGSTSNQLVGVSWSVPYNAIGTVDSAGVFTANGTIGGEVEVTATYIDNGTPVTTTVKITVTVESVLSTPNTDANAAALFAAATPTQDLTKAAGIVYPLDNVLMPQNVYPANIQWTMGAVGDIFRVSIVKPNMKFTAYVGHNSTAFTSNYLVDAKGWAGIA